MRTTRCPEHTSSNARDKDQEIARRRGTSYSRGYDKDWERVRLRALKRANYLCAHCLQEGRVVPGTEVDHVVRFNGRADSLRLDLSNLQVLCKSHHAQKTIAEDGGFGRPKKEHNGNQS